MFRGPLSGSSPPSGPPPGQPISWLTAGETSGLRGAAAHVGRRTHGSAGGRAMSSLAVTLLLSLTSLGRGLPPSGVHGEVKSPRSWSRGQFCPLCPPSVLSPLLLWGPSSRGSSDCRVPRVGLVEGPQTWGMGVLRPDHCNSPEREREAAFPWRYRDQLRAQGHPVATGPQE